MTFPVKTKAPVFAVCYRTRPHGFIIPFSNARYDDRDIAHDHLADVVAVIGEATRNYDLVLARRLNGNWTIEEEVQENSRLSNEEIALIQQEEAAWRAANQEDSPRLGVRGPQ